MCSGQRHRYSGIMVGVGTVLTDDPSLACHMEGRKNPVRIICDTHLRTPLQAQVVMTAGKIPTILATCCTDLNAALLICGAGCRVLCLNCKDGHIDLLQLMEQLGQEQIDSILLEGGGTELGRIEKRDRSTRCRHISHPDCSAGKRRKRPWRVRAFQRLTPHFI